MQDSQGSDPQYPCVFHINQAAQRAMGSLQAADLVLRDLVAMFAGVPRPRSYTGAVLAAHALNTFFLDFAPAYDRRFHERIRSARCKFDSRCCYEYVRVSPDAWSATDVEAAVRRWTTAFHAAFTAAHGRNVVAAGQERFGAAAESAIGRIARDLACSPATFRRHFRVETGVRPIDARTRARVLEPFVLLRCTTWKIDAVRAKVGWRSSKSIYEAFATILQMKPAAVRRLSHEEAAATFERIGGELARLGSWPHTITHGNGPASGAH